MERWRAGREGALAGLAAPELYDLQLFLAHAPPGNGVATAVGTRLGLLRGERDAGDARDRRHGRIGYPLPYHVAHANRKLGGARAHGNWKYARRISAAGEVTDFGCAGRECGGVEHRRSAWFDNAA